MLIILFRSSSLNTQEHTGNLHDSDSQLVWRQLRASMIWNLDAGLSVFGAGHRPHLTDRECQDGCRLMDDFLLCYQQMAAVTLQERRLAFKVRPKFHYLQHLIQHTRDTHLNPAHMGNFIDEDFMKNMRSVAHACHPSTVLVMWARRYIMKRTLHLAR